jgi:GTP 3',8-cyclase
VPGDEILARIDAIWPLEPARSRAADAAPADRYRFRHGRGEIGVITRVTKAFCGSCNRLRLAHVVDGLEDSVTEAAEECPGECIFIET